MSPLRTTMIWSDGGKSPTIIIHCKQYEQPTITCFKVPFYLPKTYLTSIWACRGPVVLWEHMTFSVLWIFSLSEPVFIFHIAFLSQHASIKIIKEEFVFLRTSLFVWFFFHGNYNFESKRVRHNLNNNKNPKRLFTRFQMGFLFDPNPIRLMLDWFKMTGIHFGLVSRQNKIESFKLKNNCVNY